MLHNYDLETKYIISAQKAVYEKKKISFINFEFFKYVSYNLTEYELVFKLVI